jgi:hypothetical protein
VDPGRHILLERRVYPPEIASQGILVRNIDWSAELCGDVRRLHSADDHLTFVTLEISHPNHPMYIS